MINLANNNNRNQLMTFTSPHSTIDRENNANRNIISIREARNNRGNPLQRQWARQDSGILNTPDATGIPWVSRSSSSLNRQTPASNTFTDMGSRLNNWGSFNAVSRNIQNARSVVDTAAAGLLETHVLLNTLREITEEAMRTENARQRLRLQDEIDSIISRIDDNQIGDARAIHRAIEMNASEVEMLTGHAQGFMHPDGSPGDAPEDELSPLTLSPLSLPEPPLRDSADILRFHVGIDAHNHWTLEILQINSETLRLRDGSGRATINAAEDSSSEIAAFLLQIDRSASFILDERARMEGVQARLNRDGRRLNTYRETLTPFEPWHRKREQLNRLDREDADRMLRIAFLQRLSQNVRGPEDIIGDMTIF